MFSKNSFWLGALLGLLTPIIVYYFFIFLSSRVAYQALDNPTLQVIAITCNVFIFRFYMIKRRLVNTGKGILLVTLIYAVYYFYNNL